jgi:prevent-host-death family protein
MTRTTTAEFKRRIDEFQDRARREPVEITREGEPDLVLMSAVHFDWLTAAAKRSHHTRESQAAVIDAVSRSEMGVEHASLDDLLK